jgi:hypothetical protein
MKKLREYFKGKYPIGVPGTNSNGSYLSFGFSFTSIWIPTEGQKGNYFFSEW